MQDGALLSPLVFRRCADLICRLATLRASRTVAIISERRNAFSTAAYGGEHVPVARAEHQTIW
jgi:hypothetical protein